MINSRNPCKNWFMFIFPETTWKWILLYQFTPQKIHQRKSKINFQFKFNGDTTMWQTIWGQFNSSIHSNKDISDASKFNYFPSFSCDEACEMISGSAPSSSNYKTAVDILQKRYGNTQLLISSFMNKFVTLAKVKNYKDIKFAKTIRSNRI